MHMSFTVAILTKSFIFIFEAFCTAGQSFDFHNLKAFFAVRWFFREWIVAYDPL